jgi:hypothetical protein
MAKKVCVCVCACVRVCVCVFTMEKKAKILESTLHKFSKVPYIISKNALCSDFFNCKFTKGPDF